MSTRFDTENLLRRLQAAGSERDQALQDLSRQDGQPRYGEAEEAQRSQMIRNQHAVQIKALESEAEAELASVKHELERWPLQDPLDRLSASEQQHAEQLRGRVREDVEILSDRELLERLRTALASKDRVRLALHVRYATIRTNSTPEVKAALEEARAVLIPQGEVETLQARQRAALSALNQLTLASQRRERPTLPEEFRPHGAAQFPRSRPPS